MINRLSVGMSTHNKQEMTEHYLSKRANWQLKANQDGSLVEADTARIIKSYLDTLYPGEYEVISKPPWFGQPYLEMDREENTELDEQPTDPKNDDVWFDKAKNLFVQKKEDKIATVKETFVPDTGILHKKSGRRYVIECKRQQAKGNAHERACKYASPSMINFIKKKLGVEYHPIGYLFAGEIVEDAAYCREIRAFFSFARQHLLLWKNSRDGVILTDWLERDVLPLFRS